MRQDGKLCRLATTYKLKSKETTTMKKVSLTRTITQIAVFSALSIVLYMFLKFPIPALFPAWLEIQISDLPALLAGFMMGPWQGVAVLAIRTLIKLPFTSTACAGELADLVCGMAFVLVSAYVYKHKRTLGGAIISLSLGCVATTIVSAFANWLVLVPTYVQLFFGGNWDVLVNMLQAIFPNATKETFYTFYIFGSVIPFNILRSVVCSLITFVLYKRLVKLFDLIFKTKSIEQEPITKEVTPVFSDVEQVKQDLDAQAELLAQQSDDPFLEKNSSSDE